jgi:DNA-binding LacI/PurR family transcriptional regulator
MIIYNHFKHKIMNGELKPGDRLPSHREIETEFKVSRITLKRALMELENAGYITCRQGSGNYVSDLNKVGLFTQNEKKKPSFISLVVPLGHPFAFDYLQGVEYIAKQKGYFVTFHNCLNNPESEREIIEQIVFSGSDGIILHPLDTSYNLALYTRLLIQRFPIVILDKQIPGLDIPGVSVDNQKSFYEITNYLLELGHKRIIFVGTDVFGISSERDRYKGFCQAHLDHGLPLLDKHLFTIKEDANILFDDLEALDPEKKPTAIAAVNDTTAVKILDTALERGISIPNQYSVTGFDDISWVAHMEIPLTTVAQPIYDIGMNAAIELLKYIKSPDRSPKIRTINGQLKIRNSTKAL